MTPREQRLVADLQQRIARYFAWCDDPQFEACPRCKGKGYHHGFGEHGHDPDWCSNCGGPGEVPTDDGMLSPDDLLKEAADALARVQEGSEIDALLLRWRETGRADIAVLICNRLWASRPPAPPATTEE